MKFNAAIALLLSGCAGSQILPHYSDSTSRINPFTGGGCQESRKFYPESSLWQQPSGPAQTIKIKPGYTVTFIKVSNDLAYSPANVWEKYQNVYQTYAGQSQYFQVGPSDVLFLSQAFEQEDPGTGIEVETSSCPL